MATQQAKERITELVARADEAIAANEHAKAASILRETSQIDPNNAQVAARWLKLSNEQGGHGSVQTVRDWLQSHSDQDLRHALELLKQKQLAEPETEHVYILLVETAEKLVQTDANSELLKVDSLLSTLLTRQNAARKSLAAKLQAQPTATYHQLYPVGDDTFKALLSVVLDTALWTSKDAQSAGQQDVFRMSLATLIEAGVERPDRAMSAVTRLLAAVPESVESLIDEGVVDIVLSDLDIRLPGPLRSQALLSTSKMLEVTGDKAEQYTINYVTRRVQKKTNDDLILAFSVAAAVFPILPAVASKLFLTEGFVQQLVPNLERNSDAAEHGKRKSSHLEQAALELLSAACVDKACREAVGKYCAHWLHGLADGREGLHKALATLILAKITSDSEQSVEVITSKLADVVLENGEESELAIEGLAYTTLQPKVKEEVGSNSKLLAELVRSLQDKPVAMFGCLTVFANLTAYRPVVSEEQKKMSQLKAYANSSKPTPEDPLDDDKHVIARCRKVLDADAVPALVACCRQTSSPINLSLVVRTLLALAKEQKHRATMAQQGAVKALLQLREKVTAAASKSGTESALISHTAAHALARILISINPAHLFSSSLPASSAVSALIPLLTPDEDAETKDLLPTFEGLLALTNLASMETDSSPRDLLIRSDPTFARLEDLMFSSNTLLQRATVELICNLMASPTCIARFADGSPDAKRRLLILCALADAEDQATRRAAGGALAGLTEWDVAVTELTNVKEGNGIKAVVGLCGDEDEGCVHRGLVCLLNIASAPGEVGKTGLKAVKEAGAEGVVKGRLGKTRNGELLRLGAELLKTVA